MTLPERFAAARSKLAQEQAHFAKRLRSRGIDPKYIYVAERDSNAETIESVWANQAPPHTVIFTDDPDYRGLQIAQLDYESAKRDLGEASPGQHEKYQAWEAKWLKYFGSTYGHFRYYDCSLPADVKAAEEQKSDMLRMEEERAQLLKEMIVQPVEVPEGWEGELPENPIVSLDDVEQLAKDALSKLRRWRDIGFMGRITLETARHSFRNAHRCLESLHIMPRPDIRDVALEFAPLETALANLLSWIESRLEEQRQPVSRLVEKRPAEKQVSEGELKKTVGIAAADLAALAKTSSIEPIRENEAVYLGDGKVRVGRDFVSIASSVNNSRVLERLLESPATYGDLERLISTGPTKVIARLETIAGGKLKPFIHRPLEKGQGYSTTIQDGRQRGR